MALLVVRCRADVTGWLLVNHATDKVLTRMVNASKPFKNMDCAMPKFELEGGLVGRAEKCYKLFHEKLWWVFLTSNPFAVRRIL